MESKHRNGDIAEAETVSFFVKNGYEISIPFHESIQYDLVIDDSGTLYRIQVKCGYWRDEEKDTRSNKFVVETRRKNSRRTKEYSNDDFDYYVIYDPKRSDLYAVPIEKMTGRRARVRESWQDNKIENYF